MSHDARGRPGAGIRSTASPRVVFVTVDPARDDAAAIKQYTDCYAAGYIGLTGSEAEIADVASDAWGITYRRLPSASAAAMPGALNGHSTSWTERVASPPPVLRRQRAVLIADASGEVAG